MRKLKEHLIFLFAFLIAGFQAIPLSLSSQLLIEADDDNTTFIKRSLGGFGNENVPEGYRNDEYSFVSIGSYCKVGQNHFITLGPCSSMYIQCSRDGHYSFQECPLEQAFDGDRCIPAFKIKSCFDPRINSLNLATEKLAHATQACDNGPGIQISTKNQCSRQALVCDSSREPRAISCSADQILDTPTLRCIPAPKICRWQPSLIKDNLLLDYCKYRPIEYYPQQQQNQNSYNPYSYGSEDSQQCRNWFVSCSDKQFIFCDGGQIYDKNHGCRPPLPQEHCPTGDVCRGWEWRAVALGDCSQQFRYCEGLKPRMFTCREGHVFQNNACVLAKFARGCPECNRGETKPTQHCRQFYECRPFENPTELWVLKSCPTNEFYNRETKRCELIRGSACADYQQTCRDGDSYNPTCGDYLLCREGQFHPGKCPHLTRWSKSSLQCIPDKTCRRYNNHDECRPGDVIPTVDCETYFACNPTNGQFIKRSCKESLYGKSPACDRCNVDKPSEPIWDTYSPINCVHGEKIVDKVDCSRFIACLHGEWISLKCENNAVFDPSSGLCVPETKSRCARSNSFDSIHLPPSPSDFGAEESFGLGGRAFPPAPPPFMDISHRKAYDEFGHMVCHHDSPRFVADPRDCAFYLECVNGFYLPRTCPPNHNFDAFSGRCSQSFRCESSCIEGQRVPRKECGKALECNNNIWVPMKCKNGGMFIDGRCSDIKCRNHEPSTCSENAVYVNEQDCTRYVICRNDQLVERQCSNGQRFDPQRLSCSYKYKCSDDSAPECYNGEKRVIKKSCSMYEECRYGEFVKTSCPYGKSFDSTTLKCRPGPCQGSGDDLGDGCTESSGLDGFRADPFNCRKFYQCANGRWVPKDCGPGTAFAPQLGVCDHIRNVPLCARS